MFGLIWLLLWAVTIFNFYTQGSSTLLTLSIILGVLNFWSLGIMHNYTHEHYTPRIWGLINFLTSIGSIVFVIISII